MNYLDSVYNPIYILYTKKFPYLKRSSMKRVIMVGNIEYNKARLPSVGGLILTDG